MRYLDTVAGKRVDRSPVWLMRQAGRYLPEYRKIRSEVSFVDAVAQPEVAAELTLQPIRRFGMDAAIIFADIMTPLAAMGVKVDFAPGPKLEGPLQSASELGTFELSGLAASTCDALTIVRQELPTDTALIGFCGAPFTLAAYLCEGGGGDFFAVRSLPYRDPAEFSGLLNKLADAMAAYLNGQLAAGANAVQIFDSWVGLLAPDVFEQFVLPSLDRLLGKLDRSLGPVTYFAPAANHLAPLIAKLEVDVVGVDWRVPMSTASSVFAGKTVQGNLDPAVLLAGPEATVTAVERLLAETSSGSGYILNVGHGLRPGTPVESVAAFVDTVKAFPE